jgi:hypothetical protein
MVFSMLLENLETHLYYSSHVYETMGYFQYEMLQA